MSRCNVCWIGCAALAIALAGCAAPRRDVVPEDVALTARPQPMAARGVPTGGIYHAAGFRPLFEDARPRYVGDVLTILINERLNASQSANSNAERKTELSVLVPPVKAPYFPNFNGLKFNAESSDAFAGKGATTSSNLFAGTITVTVTEVLANGNLVVAGEKAIGIRQNSEVLKFTGVVNPELIQPNNVISSTQVADARLDYRGGGYIEEAQIKGWLTRFFDSWWPF